MSHHHNTMNEQKAAAHIFRCLPDYEEEHPIFTSSLSLEDLEEVARRYEAARSFDDDDEFISCEVHGNTPTPGIVRPAERPPPFKKDVADPKEPGWTRSVVPKGSWLSDSPPATKAALTSKPIRPSLLRQPWTQAQEREAESANRATSEAVQNTGGGNMRGGGSVRDGVLDNGHIQVSRGPYGSENTQSANQSYAVQHPYNAPLIGEAGEDGVLHGHWDRRAV